ncbi:MAG: TlyA family RNA methyltransferase [Mycobacteriales bacterium]|nr:TlyA family RNA methyltransferase [Frankia sp.]
MVRRARLDAELVRRGLARSREQAVEVIAEGRVRVGGALATKPATAVDPAVALVVTAPTGPDFVSRGGRKLAGALDAFAAAGTPFPVADRRCLDAGASTGGFTDVLLRRGAREVVAVDVGYGQLAWSLRTDARVHVIDRTNVRHLTPEVIGGPVDTTTADLSFISLAKVLPALFECTADDGDVLVLVKPQFEAGRVHVGHGGVVRDAAARGATVIAVSEEALARGWGTHAVTTSPLRGPAGNIEYFLWLRRGASDIDVAALEQLVAGRA